MKGKQLEIDFGPGKEFAGQQLKINFQDENKDLKKDSKKGQEKKLKTKKEGPKKQQEEQLEIDFSGGGERGSQKKIDQEMIKNIREKISETEGREERKKDPEHKNLVSKNRDPKGEKKVGKIKLGEDLVLKPYGPEFTKIQLREIKRKKKEEREEKEKEGQEKLEVLLRSFYSLADYFISEIYFRSKIRIDYPGNFIRVKKYSSQHRNSGVGRYMGAYSINSKIFNYLKEINFKSSKIEASFKTCEDAKKYIEGLPRKGGSAYLLVERDEFDVLQNGIRDLSAFMEELIAEK